MIDDWCFSDDVIINSMALAMNEKFHKYWQQSNIVLAVTCFLDPRYKKKLNEYYMSKFYGDEYQVELPHGNILIPFLPWSSSFFPIHSNLIQ
jgi:hypothetical protein